MRFRTYALTALFITLLTACDTNEEAIPADASSVSINGTDYKTVSIAGLTWTATNYAGEGGMVYDAANSKPEYGKYYTYAEVKSIALPEGWRLPTEQDYRALANVYSIEIPSYKNESIKALTSSTRWLNVPGTNLSGFNAYPAGYSFNGSPAIDGDIAEFWTHEGYTLSIQESANSTLRILMYGDNTNPAYRFNVRFVKNP